MAAVDAVDAIRAARHRSLSPPPFPLSLFVPIDHRVKHMGISEFQEACCTVLYNARNGTGEDTVRLSRSK